jgi:hypothetical protein
MSTFNTPLDINQSPQKILMDALNYENRTSFSHDDFIFGTPEPFELIPGEPLTRILLTPKVGSPGINSKGSGVPKIKSSWLKLVRFS